jgi:hypothetical protein
MLIETNSAVFPAILIADDGVPQVYKSPAALYMAVEQPDYSNCTVIDQNGLTFEIQAEPYGDGVFGRISRFLGLPTGMLLVPNSKLMTEDLKKLWRSIKECDVSFHKRNPDPGH